MGSRTRMAGECVLQSQQEFESCEVRVSADEIGPLEEGGAGVGSCQVALAPKKWRHPRAEG